MTALDVDRATLVAAAVAPFAGALLADPRSPPAIAAALGRLWQEPALREALRTAGAANLARFSWERSAEVVWQAVLESMEG